MHGHMNVKFKPNLVQKFSTTTVYKALALLILLYESEIWTHRKKVQKNDRL
jgi:hypothetical protein